MHSFDLIYPLQLETDAVISVTPVGEREFNEGSTQLYRNAGKEGVYV